MSEMARSSSLRFALRALAGQRPLLESRRAFLTPRFLPASRMKSGSGEGVSSAPGRRISRLARPTRGSEIKKTRPCIVVSPDELNPHLQTVIVAPLTSVGRAYPFRVPTRFEGKSGFVVLDQLRTVDRERLAKRLGRLSARPSRRCSLCSRRCSLPEVASTPLCPRAERAGDLHRGRGRPVDDRPNEEAR